MTASSVRSTSASQFTPFRMSSLVAPSIYRSVNLGSTEGSFHPEPQTKLGKEERAALKAEKRAQRRLRRAIKQQDDAENFTRVLIAAEATVTALRQHGISCATFGSLACRLYGKFRAPKDVDLLIVQPPDNPFQSAEEVKSLIVNTDPYHFYLKLPRDPRAPYRILYYRAYPGQEDCKVDILIPGTMYLPDLSHLFVRQQIATVWGIPLVPFPLLLLHKLQGWADHLAAPEWHKWHKHIQDASDVRRLLGMALKIDVLRQTWPWNDSELFCEEFQELSRLRVKEYCAKYPKKAARWRMLGFETS